MDVDFLKRDALKSLLPQGFGKPFPSGAVVRQKFEGPELSDLSSALAATLEREEVAGRIRPGMRVALGVGSRGIASLAEIVKATAAFLEKLGAKPFIVPAMGSHGGASAQGQQNLLAAYGIDRAALGLPFETEMEVVSLGNSPSGVPVYFSRPAAEADAIVPICRIKPHTAFHGSFESGILKMLVIGFGKHKGASALHHCGIRRFPELIPELGQLILERVPVAFSVSVLENAFHRPAHVEAVAKEKILEREPQLLEMARSWMARILFDEFDVLIVDRIGKDISGDGMDPNVTGRFADPAIRAVPRIQKVVVLDLTEASHGNACGIGLADITTLQLIEKVDFRPTYTNVLTSTVVVNAHLPMILPDAESAVAAALGTCNGVEPAETRVVRIRNTLELERVWISEALLRQAQKRPDFEILAGAPWTAEL